MFVIGGVRGESAGLHGILTGWNNYARNSEKQDSDLRQEAHDQLVQQQREETKRVTQELEKVRQNIIRQRKLAALGQLWGRIAHELLYPLGAVRNAVFLLKRKLNTEEEKVQHYLMMA